MKKVLFLCNTHFQFIMATVFKVSIFKDEQVDIIITDQMVDSSSLVRNMTNIELFNQVYHVKIRDYFTTEKGTKYYLKRIKTELFPRKLINMVGIMEYNYDYFFTYNIDVMSESIFNKIYKENKNIKVCLYDEGVSTYSLVYKKMLYSSNTLKKAFKNTLKILGVRKYISDYTEDLFLLDPDLLCWDFPGNVHKIHIPNQYSDTLINTLNNIYNYNKIYDKYNEKIIFFEESYYWDNQPIDDLELVEFISNKVGKNNIIVKLHPRNRVNRFESIGYKTNLQVGIPWEVVVMNMDDESNKLFITVSSGSVLTYKLLFKKSFKTILLYKCLNQENSNVKSEYFDYFYKFSNKYPDNLLIPKNFEELRELLN